MRRTIPATLALAMIVGATPVLAADEETTTDETATQRAESARLGIAVDFPAGWRISNPEGDRISALTNADDEPIMETTPILANGGSGTWCDVDAYLDLGPEAGLEAHAFAYVSYLQQNEPPEVAMVVNEEELPAGPAYHIEIFDPTTGRIRAFYLFDGPAREDETFDRFLLTCASRDAAEPFWREIADSVEFTGPSADESEPASKDEATAEAEADPTPAEDEADAEG